MTPLLVFDMKILNLAESRRLYDFVYLSIFSQQTKKTWNDLCDDGDVWDINRVKYVLMFSLDDERQKLFIPLNKLTEA